MPMTEPYPSRDLARAHSLCINVHAVVPAINDGIGLWFLRLRVWQQKIGVCSLRRGEGGGRM